MLGLANKQPLSREIFDEALDIILGAWLHDPFSYCGKHFQIEQISIVPKPIQKPHPPVYVAAISPETFTIASRKGLKLLVTPTVQPMAELKQYILRGKYELTRLGYDALDLDFPLLWQMHIAPTATEAKIAITDSFAWYYNRLLNLIPKGENTPKTYEKFAQVAHNTRQSEG